ncbi:PIN domain-containing protein [Nocardia seriolae]|uniref:PIN domain-containing protein n=1 Tax=Nocardia seriolae TaxID=37332 RepID=UPI000519FB3B|nr:PIN domain-containing protein [Nocardia seriolae]MTJ62224.1 PIN domain-containing protein [Nocardia seriolae]MTJ74209.1 PIN domain-containing protein [Nocardia seriolae]MTJ87133.1 PIN domain-containing protein [Nocardia seriolae]MTK31127.1 PIN domain-containing protein [Nocardia seriolae]MTK40174.1 PIN domain-containing protein [Nocardia seriolae]
MILIGDTSGLIAAFNPSEPDHGAARKVLQQAALTVVSPLVLLEVEHVLTRNVNREAAYGVNDWLLAQERSGRIEIAVVSVAVRRVARRIQNRYVALRLDLTDATNVALAERYETVDVLTLDRRDFRAVAPLTAHDAFRVLPDDL